MLRTRLLWTSLLLVAGLLTLVVIPAVGLAEVTEIGANLDGATPSCPGDPCLVISRTTGYQVKAAGKRDLYVVPKDGRIVAVSFALGNPSEDQLEFFNQKLGGKPTVQVTVLRPGGHLFSSVVAQSEVIDLTPYLGKTVQI